MSDIPSVFFNPMHGTVTPSFGVMDLAFTEQVASVREAFKICLVVTAFDEPKSSKVVFEELINVSVRISFTEVLQVFLI